MNQKEVRSEKKNKKLTAWVISVFTVSLKIPSKTNESPNFSA